MIEIHEFSQRELDVMALMLKGMTAKEIGYVLGLKFGGMYQYIHSVYRKFNVKEKNLIEFKRVYLETEKGPGAWPEP